MCHQWSAANESVELFKSLLCRLGVDQHLVLDPGKLFDLTGDKKSWIDQRLKAICDVRAVELDGTNLNDPVTPPSCHAGGFEIENDDCFLGAEKIQNVYPIAVVDLLLAR